MKTILEAIQKATTRAAIQSAINYGNYLKPSGKTRRGWLKAAKKRRIEIAAL